MGLFSNKVARSSLQPGDHIYCYRKWHIYSHHGIYVEKDRVSHYTKTQEARDSARHQRNRCKNCGHHSGMAGGVIKTCVDCFLKGHRLYRFKYGVSPVRFFIKKSGTCTTGRSDSAEDSIGRATDLLSNEGFGEYNLFENNCESFAIYCKTNKHMNNQAFAAINWCERAAEAVVKHNVDRLLNDVLIHDPHKHRHLKETIENLVELTLRKIIATLGKLNTNEGDGQVEDIDEDQALKKMEKQGGGNDA